MPYYRKNLIVLWLTTFLASASWTQVVPFLPLYLQQLGVPAENLAQWSGAVFSVQFAAGILMAPIWGKIADTKGRKLMTIRAGLCLSAIYFLTAAATSPWHVLVLRFLNGALTGFIPSSMSLVATNTPQHLAARYVAYMQIASAAGNVAGPVIGGVLASLVGVRGALNLSGANVLFSTLLVILIVQERHKVSGAARSTILEDFATAAKSPALVRVVWITVLAMIGSVSIQPILVVYLSELVGDPERATTVSGIIFALPGLALMLTANLWVQQGQKRGYGTVVQTALLSAGILGVALALSRSLAAFGFFFFLQGVCLAGLRPVSSAIIADEVEEEFRGRAFGIQQAANTIGGLTGPMIAGFVSSRWGTPAVFAVIGGFLALGAVYVRLQEQAAKQRREVTAGGKERETSA